MACWGRQRIAPQGVGRPNATADPEGKGQRLWTCGIARFKLSLLGTVPARKRKSADQVCEGNPMEGDCRTTDRRRKLPQEPAREDTVIRKVFDTRSVRLSDRVAYWRDTICHNLIGVRCEGASGLNFEGHVSVLAGEQTALAEIKAGPHRAWTARDVPRERDFLYLYIQNVGQLNLRRDEGDFSLLPGDMYLHDAAMDHQFQFGESFEQIALRIPKALARQRWPELRHVRFMMFDGRSRPVNKLISALSHGLLESADDLVEREVSAAVTAAFDMFVTSVNARDPQVFDRIPPTDRLLERAKRFISAEVHNHALTATSVAAETGVSRRYLDVLFAREDTSTTAHILNLRLDRCAADLRRPGARSDRISELAYAWGFADPGQFSRAFRRRFGCSQANIDESTCSRIEQKSFQPSIFCREFRR